MGITGLALGVGRGEDGVDKEEGTKDFSPESGARGVPRLDEVSATAQRVVGAPHEGLGKPGPAHCPQTLGRRVADCPHQGQLPCKKQPERHGGIYVATCSKGF